jgi:signal transduction histidine kinase
VSSPSEHARLRHELRTPLNAIIGYSEMLLEETGTDAGPSADGLRAIVADAKHVLTVVNQRLAPAGQDAEALDLSALGADVSAPLSRILASAVSLAPGAGTAAPDLARIAGAARSLATLLRLSGPGRAAGATADAAASPDGDDPRGTAPRRWPRWCPAPSISCSSTS